MLRDTATDVFNLRYTLVEKYGLAEIEGLFSWRTDFLGNCSHEAFNAWHIFIPKRT